MLLTLPDEHSNLVVLDSAGFAQCQLSVSQALLEKEPALAPQLASTILEKLPILWTHLGPQLPDNLWIQAALAQKSQLHLSVILVTDPEIQMLNRDYRQKDQATDVLTFTLLDDMETSDELPGLPLMQLPELDLGEIYISVDWAKEAICKQNEAELTPPLNFFSLLTLYILERLIHGYLHLMGVHHDTISEYNKVVAIQKVVLNALTS